MYVVHPSLRGTFLYWMQSVTSTVDVFPEKKNKPWLSPVFPSCFPTLHTTDNSSWAVFTYLPVQKKQFFTFTESKCSQNPSLRFIVSQFWPSHEAWQTDWFCTRPVPQSWGVSVLNWGFWLVPRTVAIESRFPVGKPIHTWLAFPGVIWPSSVSGTLTRAKYYSLAKEREDTVSFSFLNLASVNLEPMGPPHYVKSEVISCIFNIFN